MTKVTLQAFYKKNLEIKEKKKKINESSVDILVLDRINWIWKLLF